MTDPADVVERMRTEIAKLKESVSALHAERQNIIATKRDQIAELQRIAEAHKKHRWEQRREIMELREALRMIREIELSFPSEFREIARAALKETKDV